MTARHLPLDFHAALFDQLRKTPWWMLSVLCHGILAFVLSQFDTFRAAADETAQVKSVVTEENLPPLVEPPDVRESEPIEEDENVIPLPQVDKDAPEADHVEEDNDQPTHEAMGKDDFLSNAPFEGPSNNRDIGIGAGAGGAFPGRGGHENLKGHGRGHREPEDALAGGLEWLKEHQDEEGMWDCDGFMKHDENAPVCDGAGNAMYDPGVSGLALLAFLGAGETHKHGRYQKTVREGLRYLKQIQDPEGCFGPRQSNHFTYNHAIGALAMAEAYGMTGSPLFKASAQNAIDFVHKCQNPYLAWRYGVRPQDNDTSVTGWMVMALKSAKISGLRVDDAAFQGVKAWLDKVTEPEYGRVGYTARGTGPARPQDVMDKWPADKSESLTAVGILSRVFVGEDPSKSDLIRKGTELCLKALPVWDEASGAIDMYYWYYGTLALFQVGGPPWKAWNEAMKAAIIDHQRKDPISFKGSWDPADPWGRDGGRVYSTALMTMCMEVYYRYPQVFSVRGK